MKPKGNLELFKFDNLQPLILKPITEPIYAGGYGSFPSAALDFPDESFDFFRHICKNPNVTFPGRISGDSMNELGILNGDICLIEKGRIPEKKELVAAVIEGQFFIKRFNPKFDSNNKLKSLKLESANKDYKDFDINEETEFLLWGTVIFTGRSQVRVL